MFFEDTNVNAREVSILYKAFAFTEMLVFSSPNLSSTIYQNRTHFNMMKIKMWYPL